MEIQKEIERIDWLKEVLDHRFLLIRGESGVGKSQLAYFLGETRQTLLNHQLKIINRRIDSLENWNPKSTISGRNNQPKSSNSIRVLDATNCYIRGLNQDD